MEWAYMGGGIAITHRGIKEVEQALRTPERRTEHFAPAINLINVGQMTGSIQQGTVSSVQVTTQTLAPNEAEGVKRFLASLADVKHDLGLNAEATAEIDSQNSNNRKPDDIRPPQARDPERGSHGSARSTGICARSGGG